MRQRFALNLQTKLEFKYDIHPRYYLVKQSDNDNTNYYNSDTKAKIIDFEMRAKGASSPQIA